MTEKELIRRALMGDKQAQEECTAKGIVLPCPFCGSTSIVKERHFGRCWYSCDICISKACSKADIEEQEALRDWNTRPAPPIGRCGECKYCIGVEKNQALRCTLNSLGVEFGLDFIVPESFCSYFEPREE